MPVIERLSPRDFYIRIDWLRDHWADSEQDETAFTLRLSHLGRLYERLPTRFWLEAQDDLERIGYLRLSLGSDEHLKVLKRLALLVGKWDRHRPQLVNCPTCGVTVRGHAALTRHRSDVHNEPPDV